MKSILALLALLGGTVYYLIIRYLVESARIFYSFSDEGLEITNGAGEFVHGVRYVDIAGVRPFTRSVWTNIKLVLSERFAFGPLVFANRRYGDAFIISIKSTTLAPGAYSQMGNLRDVLITPDDPEGFVREIRWRITRASTPE